MQSDCKRSEGKAGRLKHTAGTYSGDSDAKDLFSSLAHLCFN